MFKKIWVDPVWSKVISAAIIGLASIIYAYINNMTLGEAFNKAITAKIPAIYAVFGIALYWIAALIKNKMSKKQSALYRKEDESLKEFNNYPNPIEGTLFKWTVHFNFDNQIPHITNLTFFCTKHGETPIRFIDDVCPVLDCKNARKRIDRQFTENIIESRLIDRWEKLKRDSKK